MPDDTRPPRFRFSIGTLLLLTAVVGMALVIWRLHGENVGLRQMHADAGFLDIRDRSKFHAVYVPTYDALTWRWRVWLPEGARYRAKVVCNGITGPRLDDPVSQDMIDDGLEVMEWGSGIGGIPPGESLMTFAIRRDHETGHPRLVVELSEKEGGPVSWGRQTLRQNGSDWPFPDSHGVSLGDPNAQSQTVKVDRLLLMRMRTATRTISLSGGPPADGLMIWIEPIDETE